MARAEDETLTEQHANVRGDNFLSREGVYDESPELQRRRLERPWVRRNKPSSKGKPTHPEVETRERVDFGESLRHACLPSLRAASNESLESIAVESLRGAAFTRGQDPSYVHLRDITWTCRRCPGRPQRRMKVATYGAQWSASQQGR